MAEPQPIRPQIALLGAVPEEIDGLPEVAAVDWLTCRAEDGDRYVVSRRDQVLTVLDFAHPVFELADLVAVFGCGDRAPLDRLALSWPKVFPALPLAIEWLGPEGGSRAILGRALHHLSAGFIAERVQAGRMALDLAAYRREFEAMQRNFTLLERYLSDSALGDVREVFATPAGKAVVRLGGPDGPASVRQVLGVDSLGVAGLSILLAHLPGRPGPPLPVTLDAIETGETLATWSLDPVGTAPGWVELVLERAVDEPALTLALSIACPAGADGWAFGLGPPNPVAAYCAAGEPGGPLAAPLALRIQATLPGSRMRVRLGAVLADHRRRPARYAVPDAAYLTVSEVPLSPGEPTEFAVHNDRDFGFVQVHPLRHGAVAAARLEVMAPAEAWRVSASIYLAHEAANPVRFGILARPLGMEADRSELSAAEDGLAGFSGWHSLGALERRTISAMLPDHQGRGVVLYLLTQQDGEPSFAWARFSNLELHDLPVALRRAE